MVNNIVTQLDKQKDKQKKTTAFAFCLILISSLLWLGCNNSITYAPTSFDTSKFTWTYESVFAVGADEEKDVGTIYAYEGEMSIKKNANGGFSGIRRATKSERHGYFKNGLSSEFAREIPISWESAPNLNPSSIVGLDSLPKRLMATEQRKQWKKELLADMDTVFYKQEFQDKWVIWAQLLKPGIYQAGEKLDIQPVNKQLQTLKLDSAHIISLNKLSYGNFITVKAWFHETDSLFKMVEQYAGSSLEKNSLLKWSFQKSFIEGEWTLELDAATGFPRVSSILRKAQIELIHPRIENKKKILKGYTDIKEYFIPSKS